MSLFAILCASGIPLALKQESNGEDLWTDTGSVAHQQRPFVTDNFGEFASRMSLYATAGDDATSTSSTTNILTAASVLEFYDRWNKDIVQDITATCKSGSSCSGEPVRFPDACGRLYDGAPCDVVSVLDFLPASREDVAAMSDADVIAAVNNPDATDSSGRPVTLEDVVGGVERDDAGRAVAAAVFRLEVVMASRLEDYSDSVPRADPRSLAYEEAVFDAVLSWDFSDKVLRVLPFSDAVEDKEQTNSVNRDVTSVLPIGYTLLILYSMGVFGKRSRVQSSTALSFAAVYSVVLALVAAVGVGSALGLKFNLVVPVMALLILGLGVDDSFVLMETLEDVLKHGTMDDGSVASAAPVASKVKLTLMTAGTSILCTSVTDIVAFGLGGTTRVAALSAFSLFASLAILFCFLFMVTIFSAALTLDLRRREAGRMDWLCCVRRQPTDADKSYKTTILGRAIGHHLPKVLLHPYGKMTVTAMAIALFTLGLYGAVNLGDNFKIEWLTPDGGSVAATALQDVYTLRDEHFGGRSIAFGVYTKGGDYYDVNQRGGLDALVDAVRSCDTVGDVVSWHEGWQQWVRASGGDPTGFSDAASYYASVHSYVQSSSGRLFQKWVSFVDPADPSAGIAASQVQGFTTGDFDTSVGVRHMRGVRECVSSSELASPLEPFAYSFWYLYLEGAAIIASETIRNVILASVSVWVVTLFLLGHVGASFVTFLNVALADLELLGFMYYIDETFNVVSVINITLAVGLAVDFCAHVAKAFTHASGTGDERAAEALRVIGRSVFNGGVSTFLAVLPLVWAENWVFLLFGRMFLAIVILGLFHGLLVTPVMLSAMVSLWKPKDSIRKSTSGRTSPRSILVSLPRPVPVSTTATTAAASPTFTAAASPSAHATTTPAPTTVASSNTGFVDVELGAQRPNPVTAV